MNERTKKIAYMGLFAALASILGYVETLIPVFVGIPGIKLGLANLAVLFLLIRYSWREAALVSVVRILIIGFLFGSLFSIVFSLAGAALSLAVMNLIHKKTSFSILGVSVAGGVCHNMGQLVIAMPVLRSTSPIFYAPVLLVSGVVTGLLIGELTSQTARRIHL